MQQIVPFLFQPERCEPYVYRDFDAGGTERFSTVTAAYRHAELVRSCDWEIRQGALLIDCASVDGSGASAAAVLVARRYVA